MLENKTIIAIVTYVMYRSIAWFEHRYYTLVSMV